MRGRKESELGRDAMLMGAGWSNIYEPRTTGNIWELEEKGMVSLELQKRSLTMPVSAAFLLAKANAMQKSNLRKQGFMRAYS